MSALIPLRASNLPPARAALVDLRRRLGDTEARLSMLTESKLKLERELARMTVAKAELESLVASDARS